MTKTQLELEVRALHSANISLHQDLARERLRVEEFKNQLREATRQLDRAKTEAKNLRRLLQDNVGVCVTLSRQMAEIVGL